MPFIKVSGYITRNAQIVNKKHYDGQGGIYRMWAQCAEIYVLKQFEKGCNWFKHFQKPVWKVYIKTLGCVCMVEMRVGVLEKWFRV